MFKYTLEKIRRSWKKELQPKLRNVYQPYQKLRKLTKTKMRQGERSHGIGYGPGIEKLSVQMV